MTTFGLDSDGIGIEIVLAPDARTELMYIGINQIAPLMRRWCPKYGA